MKVKVAQKDIRESKVGRPLFVLVKSHNSTPFWNPGVLPQASFTLLRLEPSTVPAWTPSSTTGRGQDNVLCSLFFCLSAHLGTI